jgi:hypothetical protein
MITPSKVPKILQEECGGSFTVSCEGEISSIKTTGVAVEYPHNSSYLPLAGGALLRLTFDKLGINQLAEDKRQYLLKKLSATGSLKKIDSLQGLVKFRNAINEDLSQITRKRITYAERGVPSLYLTTRAERTTSIEKRFCELIYIPYEVLKEFARKISLLYTSSDGFKLSGFSGYELSELSGLPDNLDSAKILAFEFLPYFKISRDALKDPGQVINGGYFTYYNENLIVKMPNLSGEDSAGFIDNSLWESRVLNIELEKESSNVEIIDLSQNKISIVPKYEFDLISGEILSKNDREFYIELASDIDLKEKAFDVYLSPSFKDPSSFKSRGFKVERPFLDIVSAPLLTKPFSSFRQTGSLPTYTIPESEAKILAQSNFKKDLAAYIPNDLSSYFSSGEISYDFLLTNANDYESILGEQTNSEALLSGVGLSEGFDSNESKIYSSKSKSYSGSPLFASCRPKIFNRSLLPSFWIKSTDIFKVLNEEGSRKHFIYFSRFDFDKIFSNLGFADIDFAVYIVDNNGQISRSTSSAKFYAQSPSISQVVPSGYSGQWLYSGSKADLIINGNNLYNDTYFSIVDLSGASSSPIILKPNDPRLSFNYLDLKTCIISFQENLEDFGLTSGVSAKEYSIQAISPSGKVSSDDIKILISSSIQISEDSTKPDKILYIGKNNFYASSFGKSESIHSIPIIVNDLEQRASISLKTNKYISSEDINNGLYCYLAFEESVFLAKKDLIYSLTTPERVVSVIADNTKYYLLYDFFAKASLNSNSDFYFSTEDFSCQLKFPFNSLVSKNCSALLGLSNACFIISLMQITSSLTLRETTFSLLKIGDEKNQAFTSPPYVLGFGCRTQKDRYRFIGETLTSEYFKDEFGEIENSEPSFSNIFKQFSVIFTGAKEKSLKQKYSFKLGDIDITPYVSKIKYKKNGHIFVKFSDFEFSQSGIFNFIITKKDAVFGCTYSNQTAYKSETIYISKESGFQIDPVENFLHHPEPTSEVISSKISSSIFGSEDKYKSFSKNSFLIRNSLNSFSDRETLPDFIVSLNLSSIVPLNLSNIVYAPYCFQSIFGQRKFYGQHSLSINNSNLTNIYYNNIPLSNFDSDTSIFKDVYLKNSELKFNEGSYIVGEQHYLCTLSQQISSPCLIKANLSTVIGIGIGTDPSYSEVLSRTVAEGDVLSILVDSPESSFVIIINEVVIKPDQTIKIEEGVYSSSFRIPQELVGKIFSTQECMVICTSSVNAKYLKAADRLGQNFLNDIEKQLEDLLGGVTGKGMPDIESIWQKASNFSLSLGPLNIDRSLASEHITQSFCDASFSMTANLEASLRNYQVLLVPIKIIFAIIDVICALLNPSKLAKATARLFQALYELLALLPQISVPISVIKLIAHALNVIECLSDKVIFITTAINRIIDALQEETGIASVLALEQILNEYLFQLDATINVLQPITSILAIFLELLQINVNFPCGIDAGNEEVACGIDGTLLGGIVSGIMAEGDQINPSALIPVAQSYTEDQIADVNQSTIIDPSPGEVVAIKLGSQTLLEAMNVDDQTLRATPNFPATFVTSATRSKRFFGTNPRVVKFVFNERGRGFRKIIDPDLPLDSKISLLSLSSDKSTLSVKSASSYGNFYSPIDGFPFMQINDGKGSIKPLVLTFEMPIYDVDEVTKQVVQVGVETITRTFDDVPSMVMMDDKFDLYFIEPDGIIFNSDKQIESIVAKIINKQAAEKSKFSREDEYYDSNEDGVITEADDTKEIYDFPNLYFFDMRQAADQIQQFCFTSSINNFLIQVDTPDDIISSVKGCVDQLLTEIKANSSAIKLSLKQSKIPTKIDVQRLKSKFSETTDCLNQAVSDLCPFVVNSLNTSFKVLEDESFIARPESSPLELPPEIVETFNVPVAALTGAREYAAGIGDDAQIPINKIGTIQIIPRESYDNTLPIDFTDKISFEIIEDTTGTANIIPQVSSSGTYSTKKVDDYYIGQVTASSVGRVKLKAKICSNTIQAVTYASMVSSISTPTSEVGCVDDVGASDPVPATGALTRVDRIITVYFIDAAIETAASITDREPQIITTPQIFGTSLE